MSFIYSGSFLGFDHTSEFWWYFCGFLKCRLMLYTYCYGDIYVSKKVGKWIKLFKVLLKLWFSFGCSLLFRFIDLRSLINLSIQILVWYKQRSYRNINVFGTFFLLLLIDVTIVWETSSKQKNNYVRIILDTSNSHGKLKAFVTYIYKDSHV